MKGVGGVRTFFLQNKVVKNVLLSPPFSRYSCAFSSKSIQPRDFSYDPPPFFTDLQVQQENIGCRSKKKKSFAGSFLIDKSIQRCQVCISATVSTKTLYI